MQCAIVSLTWPSEQSGEATMKIETYTTIRAKWQQ